MLQALLETHDSIAEKSYSVWETDTPSTVTPAINGQSDMNVETIRVVGLRKNPNEPLVSFILLHLNLSFNFSMLYCVVSYHR